MPTRTRARRAAAPAAQVLEAVAYMHELRLVHTDLKPENILLVGQEHMTLPPAHGSKCACVLVCVCVCGGGGACVARRGVARVSSSGSGCTIAMRASPQGAALCV
jgi:serine/threonine protein kinase